MASKLVGRTVCPECGNQKAHVKIMAGADGTPVAGKRHYRHCPDGECGAQYFPRNDRQEKALVAKTRPEGTAMDPVNAEKPQELTKEKISEIVASIQASPIEVMAKPDYKLVFGVRVPA